MTIEQFIKSQETQETQETQENTIEGFEIQSIKTTVTPRSNRANLVAELRAKLTKELHDTMKETKPSKNLPNGVKICVVPINPDAYQYTQPETMTVYHYEHKEALKRLVSLDGRFDVEVQYMGVVNSHGKYDNDADIFGEARHDIESFINLCSWFPSVPMYLVSWCINHFDTIEEAVEALAQHTEEYVAFTFETYTYDNKTDAFIAFLEDYEDVLNGIPSHIKPYIDWKAMMNDREGIDIFIQQLEPRRFLVVRLEDC